jgi:LysR family nitrogen assimilation transcriptional regulator
MPDASISIGEGLSTTLQDGLINGRLDVAVLYNAQPAEEIDLLPLTEEELVLVTARAPGLAEDPPPGPIALKALVAVPLVIPSRPNAIRMHVESAMAGIGCRPCIALEIDGVSAILDLVADGAGSALLSRNAVASSIKPSAFSVRAVCDPPLRTRLSIATSALRPTTLTQKATMTLLSNMICDLIPPVAET